MKNIYEIAKYTIIILLSITTIALIIVLNKEQSVHKLLIKQKDQEIKQAYNQIKTIQEFSDLQERKIKQLSIQKEMLLNNAIASGKKQEDIKNNYAKKIIDISLWSDAKLDSFLSVTSRQKNR